jgi:hypothetical protein
MASSSSSSSAAAAAAVSRVQPQHPPGTQGSLLTLLYEDPVTRGKLWLGEGQSEDVLTRAPFLRDNQITRMLNCGADCHIAASTDVDLLKDPVTAVKWALWQGDREMPPDSPSSTSMDGSTYGSSSVAAAASVMTAPVPPTSTGMVHVCFFELWNDPLEPILMCIHTAVSFLQEGLKRGENILCHCDDLSGSRSASLVVAFMIVALRWTLPYALSAVMQRKPSIVINEGFLKQLDNLYRIVHFAEIHASAVRPPPPAQASTSMQSHVPTRMPPASANARSTTQSQPPQTRSREIRI